MNSPNEILRTICHTLLVILGLVVFAFVVSTATRAQEFRQYGRTGCPIGFTCYTQQELRDLRQHRDTERAMMEWRLRQADQNRAAEDTMRQWESERLQRCYTLGAGCR